MSLSLDPTTFEVCFGSSFSFKLDAESTAPREAGFDYSFPEGGLPPSLILNGDTVSGVFTNSGTYVAVLRVTDTEYGEEPTTDFDLTFIVSAPLRIDSTSISPVVPSIPYEQQLIIHGASPGEGTIALDDTQLPDGIGYNPATNTLYGTTLVQDGVYPVSVVLTLGECTNTHAFNLLVYRLGVEPFVLCVIPNVDYYSRLFTLNGIMPFTWEIVGDPLPDYLSLSPHTGEITGSAAEEGVTYTVVRVTDGLGNTASTDLTVSVSSLCESSSRYGPGTPPVSAGKASWIPSLQSKITLTGSKYFEDNLIKYLPNMYGH